MASPAPPPAIGKPGFLRISLEIKPIQNIKLIRIEPAFDDPESVRAMFERYAPYRTMAGYLPIKSMEETALPWFRGNWATNGEPLVAGAEKILHNQRFINAAREFFDGSVVRPTFIVVNVNAPMSAGQTHVDIPSFRGATRDQYPLPFLVAIGQSGLFESWRVIQAGALTWFYEGPGGNFEYWPEGLNGPMSAERPPFRNVAIMTDNDRVYHRIGQVGDPAAKLPEMTSAAEIRPLGSGAWEIVENGETRATYPSSVIRLSLLWKAIRESEAQSEALTLDRVMSIFIADLRQRNIDFRIPGEPLSDSEWMALLDRTYYVRPGSKSQ
jgi:hypothetical protein